MHYHDFLIDSKHIHECLVDLIQIKNLFRHWIQFHTNSSFIEIVLKIHIQNLNENLIVYFFRSNDLQNVRNISILDNWIVEIIVIVFEIDENQNFIKWLSDFVLIFDIDLNVVFVHEFAAKNNVWNLIAFFVIVNLDIYFLECSHIVFEFRNDLKRTICTSENEISILCVRVLFDLLIFNTAKIYCNFYFFLVVFEVFNDYNIFFVFDKFIDDLHEFENICILTSLKKRRHNIIRWFEFIDEIDTLHKRIDRHIE